MRKHRGSFIRSFDRRRAAFRGCSAIRKVPGGGAWEAVLFPPAWGPSPSGLGRGRGRGGAGCARQLCQATALLSKCSAKQQTHKHRMQPSASRWWVLVRAPHSSCTLWPRSSRLAAPPAIWCGGGTEPVSKGALWRATSPPGTITDTPQHFIRYVLAGPLTTGRHMSTCPR